MYYLHHVHTASASAQSVYLPYFLPSGPCLCVVHHSSLSFLALGLGTSQTIAPLSEIFSVPINGRILRIARLPSKSSASSTPPTDRIVVLTDHHQPRLFVLRYGGAPTYALSNDVGAASASSTWTQVHTEAMLLLEELGRPAAESGLTLEVEEGPEASYIFSHSHAGILKVARLHGSPASMANNLTLSGTDVTMGESDRNGAADLARAFGVRLPHPHLISSTFLARRGDSSPSSIALLSLSSTASRLPGLGMQCLPVLSFHFIDEANQELQPLMWGPPRKVPAQSKKGAVGESREPASANTRRTSQSRSMPGSLEEADECTTPKAQSSKRHGPAAMGARRTAEEDEAYEEGLAKAPLTRAHVPLPFLDALGAHLLLPLPAQAGGGVLVFSETSVLLVPPPPLEANKEIRSPLTSKAKVGAGLTGKRRKSSFGEAATSFKSAGGQKSQPSSSALSISPTSPTAAVSPSNENGKRRRSTASSAATLPGRRRSSAAANSTAPRILRLDLPAPVIVSSACVVKEPTVDGDDGVRLGAEGDKASLQVLFATHAGRLELLSIALQSHNGDAKLDAACQAHEYSPADLSITSLGQISAPAGPGAITYLGENFVHIASTSGDSTLIQIRPDDREGDAAAPATSLLQEVHRWPNLAPILDFVVDDGAGGDPAGARSAQARIITCSGSGPAGSLRIVRNGVGLEDYAYLDEQDVRRVWSIEGQVQGATELLILGFVKHTRILSFGSTGFDDQTVRFSAAGLDVAQPVLAAAGLGKGVFTIVNSGGVHLLNTQRDVTLASWHPSNLTQVSIGHERVTRAAVNEAGQALLGFKTGHLVLLQIRPEGIDFVMAYQLESEVSALDLSPTNGQYASAANMAAVALWKPPIVKLLSLPDLRDVTPANLFAPQLALVRSVKLHTFAVDKVPISTPYLLIGLGDGCLTSYSLSLPTADSVSQTIGVLERRSASLGSQPLHLRDFTTSKGLHTVFAACDRPSLIFSQGTGLNYSSVRHRDVVDVCPLTFRPSSTGDASDEERLMVFVMPDQLRIVRMGEISRLDIASVSLGHDNPVSIAMCAEQKVVGVVTTRFLPEGRGSAPVRGGKVMLRNIEDFDALHEHELELEERPNCIEKFTRSGSSYLVVGTGYTLPDRTETTSGRLLIFCITPDTHRLQLVSSRNVDGNVFDVKALGSDRLVACVNAKVIAFDVEEDDATMPDSPVKVGQAASTSESLLLMQVGEWACAFTATTLSVISPSKIVVGDALRSIVILGVEAEAGKLIELARDCDPYWTVACESLDEEDEVYVGSDIAFNLWTCRRLKWSQSAKDRLEESRLRESERGTQRTGNDVDLIDRTWSHIMQRDAAFHYGDMVNKMKRGALVAQSGTSTASNRKPAETRIVFATAAGALGVIAKLDERAGRILTQLEMKLQDAWAPVGQIGADEYRTLRTDHRIQPAAGFIDGDTIRCGFEPLSHEARALLLRRGRFPLDGDLDEVNSLVEALNRLS